ncbi:D-amino acid dehydrogenase small subunit [Planctomycetes bacterium Pan216]|uniref:D-amino acid dehydrogenase small subunit n=1 Tax=Kolteria novifilia TaxID=2527975 RepID=A0A518B1F2_9BACT|nr:D-amino acid dehydrogenase small subunit [Planctomycetes bacterium Pan216]
MLKVANVRLPVGESEEALPERVAKVLKLRSGEIERFRILRKSLDVRDKRRLEYVYTTAVGVADESSVLARIDQRHVAAFEPNRFDEPHPGERPLAHRPIVVGAGPAGLFAAYVLAEYGYAPIVLERGKRVRDRVHDVQAFDDGGPLDPESNYLFGEGGAGTFSDGKLTCRTTGPDTDRVLEIFATSKGKPSVVYEAKPHLGSNRLPAVVKSLRRQIIANGGEFRFDCRVDDLDIHEGCVRGVHTSSGPMAADVVVLAIGHSARDTYEMLLRRGVSIVPKAFQMGVRIEQPQENVNRCQFGTSPQAALLGPADYTMKVHAGDRDLFTFCMCAGGYVMPSVSQHGYFCTNGMSRAKHESPFANSGLVMTVDPATLEGADDPLVGIRYQERIEQAAFAMTGGTYHSPIQWAHDFVARRPSPKMPPSSYARGVQSVDLWELLPSDVAETLCVGLPLMDRRWRGSFLKDATLVGPEARGSCPVRLPRDTASRQSEGMDGLYPIGEGAGYAGGIVSAAVDGLRTARVVINAFRPLG